jgi:hypothetical protein
LSNPVLVSRKIPQPANVHISVDSNSVVLNWHSIPGIHTYEILRSTDSSGLIAYETVNDTVFNDYPEDTETYYYRVQGLNELEDGSLSELVSGRLEAVLLED